MATFGDSLAAGLILSEQINYGTSGPSLGPKPKAAPKPVAMSQKTLQYPTAPMISAVITDSGILGNPDVPDYQPAIYGGNIPPSLIPLQMDEIALEVECYINTSFITVKGLWKLHCVRNGRTCDCLLTIPMHEQGTITGVEIDIEGRVYATQLVPSKDATQYAARAKNDEKIAYNPNLFFLQIPKVKAGAIIALKVTWFQTMPFLDGQFFISVPFTFPRYVLPPHKGLSQVTKISYTVNAGAQREISFGPFSHPMKEISTQLGQVSLVYDGEADTGTNADFVCSYKVWSEVIWSSFLTQVPTKLDVDQRGTFCLFLSPPDPRYVQAFKRVVVFLIDRSGSMHGKSMEEASQAILLSLSKLTSTDRFNIIAFDHESLLFSSYLQYATDDMINNAKDWISKNCEARGGTNILGPLNQAMDMLSKVEDAIPYIFLITDGAVEDEQSICRIVKTSIANGGLASPRISTFGIGHYCNHYFLRMLALIGKGLYDAAFNAGTLKLRVERMLLATSKPLLTNVSLVITDHLDEYEIYPFPIPDLFSGSPLIISGRFAGKLPDFIKVVGTLPDTANLVLEVQAQKAEQIPLNQVFAKQQLDLLTSQAWFFGNKQLEEQAIKISISTSVPCEFTQMVAFETSKEKYSMLLQERQKGNKIDLPKYLHSKTATVALVGGLTLGFGSISATASNTPIGFGEEGLSHIIESFNDALHCCDLSLLGDCCCTCCSPDADRYCSRLSDVCLQICTQTCISFICFGCIEACLEVCCNCC